MAEAKKGASKLPKSEITTVRLDPKLRYMAELAARKQRRSLSSFIEWAVEHSLKEVKLYEGSGYGSNDDTVTVADATTTLWDVDDAERFIRLAIRFPELLTHEEQERWKMLNDSSLLTMARKRNTRSGSVDWNWAVLEDEVFPTVRRYWPALLQAQVEGQAAREKWIRVTSEDVEASNTRISWTPQKTKASSSSGFDDMDDDIPF